MSIINAKYIYYRETRYGYSQFTFMSDILFDSTGLPKAVRKVDGVSRVTILGDFDSKGAFVPLSVESYGGYSRNRGLFHEERHLPLPVVKGDRYRTGLLTKLEYNLSEASARAALSA